MATLRSARAAALGVRERGRAALLGLLAGVALVVVTGAVVLGLREPGATTATAPPRDAAVDIPAPRPAPATAPAPTREEAPIAAIRFDPRGGNPARRLDESEPTAKATLAVL